MYTCASGQSTPLCATAAVVTGVDASAPALLALTPSHLVTRNDMSADVAVVLVRHGLTWEPMATIDTSRLPDTVAGSPLRQVSISGGDVVVLFAQPVLLTLQRDVWLPRRVYTFGGVGLSASAASVSLGAVSFLLERNQSTVVAVGLSGSCVPSLALGSGVPVEAGCGALVTPTADPHRCVPWTQLLVLALAVWCVGVRR